MTPEEFRRRALQCSDAIESAHMQHPDFRVGGKIFATLGYPDSHHGMVKLTPAQQRVLVEQSPQIFQPSAGAWGRQGCTSVYLPAAEKSAISAALSAAASNLMPGRKKKKP